MDLLTKLFDMKIKKLKSSFRDYFKAYYINESQEHTIVYSR